MTLKNNIEAIIIKWAYQIDKALSKDSASGLNTNGQFPGPMTEIRFWEAKGLNLESLYDQCKDPTTRKMASILNLTDRYSYKNCGKIFVLYYFYKCTKMKWFEGKLNKFLVHKIVRNFFNFISVHIIRYFDLCSEMWWLL